MENLPGIIEEMERKQAGQAFSNINTRFYNYEVDRDQKISDARFVELSSALAFALSGTLDIWRPRYLLVPAHIEKRLATYLGNVALDYGSTTYMYEADGSHRELWQ